MPRTQRILCAGEPRGAVVDTLLLKFADRGKQQGFAFGGKGTCVEFDFPQPPRLRTDDLLVLDDGTLVEVVADAEPLLELRMTDFAAAARLAWMLGNRHVPVAVLANRIRMLRSAATEALLAERGLAAVELTAPFDPDDGGACAQGHGGHDHAHHDHAHHDHAHHEHASDGRHRHLADHEHHHDQDAGRRHDHDQAPAHDHGRERG